MAAISHIFGFGWVARSSLPAALACAALFSLPHSSYAQGCSQCLDSTRATPPSVQAAYRHAIFLLGGAGLTIFLGGAWLLHKSD